MNTATEIDDALRWVSPDSERPEWVRILMAVKSALGDAGRDIAEAWSQGSDRYRASDFAATWRSLKENGPVTAASLFKVARDAGWKPTSTVRPPPRPREKPVERPPEPSRTLAYAVETWARVKKHDALVAAHPYCQKKGVTHAAGAGRAVVSGRVVGQDADCVIVPLRTYPDEDLCGVECINGDGAKQTFGSKGVLIIGNDLDPALPQLVCEGWACGVGLFHQYHGNVAVYIAFGKGKLDTIAAQVAARHPRRDIIICREAD